LQLGTDAYPRETTWQVKDLCNGDTVVLSGGPYEDKNTRYTETSTLGQSSYSLQVIDSYGDGLCCGTSEGSFSASYDGNPIGSAQGNFGAVSETFFFGGSCPVPSGEFTLKLTTDRYPRETTWEVKDVCDGNKVVLSGDSYSDRFTLFTETATLGQSEYALYMYDSYGDGIGAAGTTSFYATFEGAVIGSGGGDFGSVDSHSFVGNDGCPS
jgi:hypothetical protein